MIRTTQIAIVLALAAAGVVASHPAQGGASVELTESVRVAFYERAPGSVVASMRAAVQRECTARRQRDAAGARQKLGLPQDAQVGPGEATWICGGGHLNYLRGVDVLGNLQQTGYVCRDQGISSNMKFFLADMLVENSNCLFMFFDAKEKRHFLEGGGAH